MFTGIIGRIGTIERLDAAAADARLTVAPQPSFEAIEAGESIAVNGVCLTAEAGSDGAALRFYVSGETLKRTTLGGLRRGGSVNLERALRSGDRLGGHFATGHVDAVGEIVRFDEEGEGWRLGVRFPAELAPFIAVKGSIAIDGISLTVAALRGDVLEAAIVPHTREATTLREAQAGTRVNLEIDVIARHVVRAVEALAGKGNAGGLTLEKLTRAGFVP